MATKSQSSISKEELGQIARVITSKDMSQIAKNYLGLDPEEIAKGDTESEWKSNYKILKQWKKTNRGNATRQDLADKLRTAAKKSDFDYSEVEEILGMPSGSYESGPELTDQQITELSHRISSTHELRALAIGGLQIEDYVVAKVLSNHKEISTQTYRLLSGEWMKTQPNRKAAYIKLCEALKNVNMAYYVRVVLEN